MGPAAPLLRGGAHITNESDVIVIGAGVSGLACARELTRAGRSVIVLDRARGVGGRCATRTIHGQRVDYGVHFLHGQNPHFLSILEEQLPAEGYSLVPGWPGRVREPRLACQPDAYLARQRRLAVREGVSALPRVLALGLDVRLGTLVQWLTLADGRVEAVATDGARFRARHVVVALAGPQAVRLLEPVSARLAGGRDLVERLQSLPCLPCLAVVAGYDAATPAPAADIDYPFDTTILHSIAHDSAKRAAPGQRVLVLQARARYSEQHRDADPESWTRDMVWEAGEILGAWAAAPLWTYAHRWSWARVPPGICVAVAPVWLDAEPGGRVGLCGEGFMPPGGVEGAFLSGVDLARQLLQAPDAGAPAPGFPT